MKRMLLSTAGIFSITLICYGQGTVNFSTRVSGVVVGHVYDFDPHDRQAFGSFGNTASETPAGTRTYAGALLAGSGFSAQLWAANGLDQPASMLIPVSPIVFFRTGAILGGTPTPIIVAVPGIPAGGTGTFQVRAWGNFGNPSTPFEAGLPSGASQPFNVTNLGDGVLTLPADMVGFRSFSIAYGPEPGPLALLTLGGLGLLIFRRKKLSS